MWVVFVVLYIHLTRKKKMKRRNWKQWIEHGNLENNERIVGKWISESCALFCFHATFRLKRVLQIGGV